MKRLTPAIVALLTLAACPDDAATDTSDTGTEVDSDTPDTSDTSDTSDTGDGSDTTDTGEVDINPGVWPWPLDPVTVPAGSWKAALAFPDDDYLADAVSSNGPRPRWVKFLVFTSDPSKVYFQDSKAHPTHFEFAQTLPPFSAMDKTAFEAATLGALDTRKAIVGHVLYPPRPWTASPGPFAPREVGVTLLGDPPYPAHVVQTVLDLVGSFVTANDAAADPEVLYFPTPQQLEASRPLSPSASTRWDEYATCYATGWAVGRLVEHDDPVVGFARGELSSSDIVVTDIAPDTLPPIAGLIVRHPSSAASRTAALARTTHAPFIHFSSDVDTARLTALMGHDVLLRAANLWSAGCVATIDDLEGHLETSHHDALADLATFAAPHIAAATPTDLIRPVASLTSADLSTFGGLSVHHAFLAKTLPDLSTSGFAVSFSLYDHVSPFAARIADLTWPPAAALTDLRNEISETPISASHFDALRQALDGADLTNTRLAVRLSTNFTSLTTVEGEGLHPTRYGCLGDDLDADEIGPSACGGPEEEPLSEALALALSDLWSLESFAYRHHGDLSETAIRAGALLTEAPTHSLAGRIGAQDSGASSVSHTFYVQRSPWLGSSIAPPEIQTASIYSFGTFMTSVSESTAGEYGVPLLTEAEYTDLSAHITTIQTAWARTFSPRPADLYTTLGFTRSGYTWNFDLFTPSPRPSREASITPYLVPGPAVTLCTFQGEAGGLLGNHRLKHRVTLDHRAGFLDRTLTGTTLFTHLELEGTTLTQQGDPTAFTNFSHEAPTIDQWGSPTPMGDLWETGSGAAKVAWRLDTLLPIKVTGAEAPTLTLGDASMSLTATYTSPMPEPGQWPDGTTTADYIRLSPCPDTEVITPRHIPNHRTGNADSMSVDIRFWWPPTPTGATAGYTAPLAKWEQTTLTGFTSTPITLRGYWSQTYRPGHHNFSEDFVFEPRLEEGLDPALIAELDAKNIAALIVTIDYSSFVVQAIGLDGKIRPLVNQAR